MFKNKIFMDGFMCSAGIYAHRMAFIIFVSAVRFAFILFLTILFYNMHMLAFHVLSRATRRRSRKKHSSSSLELVQGVMKPLMLICWNKLKHELGSCDPLVELIIL